MTGVQTCALPICEQTNRIKAIKKAWEPGETKKSHIFWDSDIAKWLEAACYSLIHFPDPKLEAQVKDIVDSLIQLQEEDGYLNSYYTQFEPENRWTNLRDQHELYCAGHLIEAAVAHFMWSGDNRFVKTMERYVALIRDLFGPNPEQQKGYPGHQEIELALIKLYKLTRNPDYLQLSAYFIEERGNQPHYFDEEAKKRGGASRYPWKTNYEYAQAHLPIREQKEVIGHAVRGMYMYTAMADLARELDDPSLLDACKTLWNDLVTKKLYLTGGIGSSSHNEGFTKPYDLPNYTAYAETCASIGLVYWAQRMIQIDCDSTYADIIETALYNGIISGVSLDGERFFYDNPLASHGDKQRSPFFECSCCPPNVLRLLASLGDYIYTVDDQTLIIHQYISNRMEWDFPQGKMNVDMDSGFPWEGEVRLVLDPNSPMDLCMKFRIPRWCSAPLIRINGELVDTVNRVECGYLLIQRAWNPKDEIHLQFPMEIHTHYAHPQIQPNSGKVAFTRGPLVYCVEELDNPEPVHYLVVGNDSKLAEQYDPTLLEGVVVITGEGWIVSHDGWKEVLYRQAPPDFRKTTLKAIPYYTWNNRNMGSMTVWINQLFAI